MHRRLTPRTSQNRRVKLNRARTQHNLEFAIAESTSWKLTVIRHVQSVKHRERGTCDQVAFVRANNMGFELALSIVQQQNHNLILK